MADEPRASPVALSAAVAGLVAAATALAVVGLSSRRDDPAPVAAPIRPREAVDLEPILSELRTLREAVTRLQAIDANGKSSPLILRSEAPGSPVPPTRERGEAQVPAGNHALAEDAAERWDEEDGFRRTWLFRPARDVLRWLGAPTDVVANEDGRETWIYRNPEGSGSVWFHFHDGRLIGVE